MLALNGGTFVVDIKVGFVSLFDGFFGLGRWGLWVLSQMRLTCPNPPTMRTALTFLFVAAIWPRTRATTSWTTGSKILDTSAPVIRNLPRRTPWAGSSARPGTVIVC